MSKEAMKLALEALEEYTNVVASENNPDAWVTVVDAGKPAREAITALREALASEAIEQPAQQEAQIDRWKCPCGNKDTFQGVNEGASQPKTLTKTKG